MAEVSFYILPSSSQQERHLFTCRLIEKAYQNQQFCYVNTQDTQQSQQLDNQLWRFKTGSFIPHQIFEQNLPEFKHTILIGSQAAPDNWQEIIINLSSEIPDYSAKTERVLEILDNNENIKQAGRVRYKQYQQAGHTMTTHNM